MHTGVVPVTLGKKEVLLSRVEEGLTGEGLSIGQALGQGVAPRLGQQQQADDAQQGAAGEDDVMQEVALLVVELHDGCSEHPKTSASQDQAQPTAPAQRRRHRIDMVQISCQLRLEHGFLSNVAMAALSDFLLSFCLHYTSHDASVAFSSKAGFEFKCVDKLSLCSTWSEL